VRPRDLTGKAWRRVAAAPVSDLERIHQRKKSASKELQDLVAATGTTLMDRNGIGPGGRRGTTTDSSATDSHPTAGS